jgi:hypothetical protein
MLRRSVRNGAIIYGQMATDRLSRWLGDTLERFGVKTSIKRLLRSRRA